MREFVAKGAEREKISRYLFDRLGEVWVCCGVPAPTQGSVIRVTQSIQACPFDREFPTAEYILPGTYRVVRTYCEMGDHWIVVSPIAGGSRITLYAGRLRQTSMDWRGVENAGAPPVIDEPADHPAPAEVQT